MVKECEFLIIGSGIAGYHALKELLEKKPKAKIIMVTSDTQYPYDRPPLSKYYLRGEMPRDKVFFESEEFYRRENLKVILKRNVQRINGKEKVAILDNNEEIRFEKALIATGGRPRKLGLPSESLGRIFYLRTLDDADKLKEAAEKAKRAVIVGGGFIGVEVASSFTTLGVKTTVIEVKPYIWNTFLDENISRFIQKYFESKGVSFILNESVKEFLGQGNVNTVVTEGGKKIEADLVLISIGIIPNVEIANNSGIEVKNGIIVDEYLMTNIKDVYAAGDVANILDPLDGKRKRIEHWNNAEYTGRLAAKNMLGEMRRYNFLSTIWSDIFDLHIESAGDTMDYDEYLIRGKMEISAPSFTVIYLKGGVIKGYVAINRESSELEALNNLILNKVNVSNKKEVLIDSSSDLSKILT
ncbi:MAG: FAD/NAD(P)-binding oxidoreductase [Sulfolobaceae archaeon]